MATGVPSTVTCDWFDSATLSISPDNTDSAVGRPPPSCLPFSEETEAEEEEREEVNAVRPLWETVVLPLFMDLLKGNATEEPLVLSTPEEPDGERALGT